MYLRVTGVVCAYVPLPRGVCAFLVIVVDSIWPRKCIRAGVSNAIKMIALVV